MNDQASPATTLHDVLVVHDQSGTTWLAARATIRAGRIVVAISRATPPEGFFDRPTSTYSIRALDGGDRVRTFPHVTLASRSARELVFD